jgi:hypothetical protein
VVNIKKKKKEKKKDLAILLPGTYPKEIIIQWYKKST